MLLFPVISEMLFYCLWQGMQSNALGYYCNWTVLDFYALSCLHFNSHWLISCNKVEPSLLCWWSREANHRTWWHLGLSCLCTAGLLQSSSETLFNEIWNACWLYIDMWGNVWAKAAVTNPQVLSTAYKPNVGIPRFISLTFCMILWGWNQRKSTTSEALSLTAELQIPWDQQCPEISPILGAPEKVKENGTSTYGILASRGWYGINEKGGKKDSVSANCSRSTKALALSSWLGKFRDNGGWQWIS